MSRYRLTEKNVKDLNLVPTDWSTLGDECIPEVFIRAHEDSPMYGPYLVYDYDQQLICKQDGSDVRRYPRSKGLYVRSSDMPASFPLKEENKIVLAVSVVDNFLDELKQEIEDVEDHLESLYKKQESLNEVMKVLTE